jgi:ribosome biogenesis GTPase / thiamine phosphate phosphatase
MSREMDYEEFFHAQRDRKQGRKDRKIARESDRSKYKKTDQKESAPKTLNPSLNRGRVIAITGEGIWADSEGVRRLCSLKGYFKKEKTEAKNLIAVGDFVRFNEENAIEHIEERYSSLSRADISGRKEQLIAVNVDQAIIVISVVNPPLKPSLIDRYLIAAAKGNLHPVIVINKVDLLESHPEEAHLYREFLAAYEPLGIPILSISTKTKVGIDALRSILKNKTSVFSGQSGVGKSSLLNTSFNLQLRTGDLAHKTAKGTHTTTTAELLSLEGGGYCVDTPGIRSFGVWDLKREDVREHFQNLSQEPCKFPDCAHISEPSCAVLRALEEGHLPFLRYQSYRALLDEATGGKDNRTKRKENED